MDVNNQLTDGLLGVTMNLLMCDKGVHCTPYKPQSNVVSTYFYSAIPKNDKYKYDVNDNSLL